MRPLGSAVGPLHPALALAATVVGVAAMFAGGSALAGVPGMSLRLQIAVASALLAVPGLLVLALRGKPIGPALALERPPSRTLILSGLLALALWLASVGLMELQSVVMPPPPEYLEAFRRLHEALRADGAPGLLASLIVIAILPGVSEELLMRGILLPSLLPALGAPGAILTTAAAFAAMHGDAYRFLFTFVVGLVLGAVRVRSGSLVPPIVAHATLNAVTFLVAPLVDDPSQTVYTPQPALGLACLLVGSALTLAVARALRPFVDSPEKAT